MTQVRRAYWSGQVAEVGIWPYDDEIAAAVRERLAPLEALVEPQDWLPTPTSTVGPTVWIAGERPPDAAE